MKMRNLLNVALYLSEDLQILHSAYLNSLPDKVGKE